MRLLKELDLVTHIDAVSVCSDKEVEENERYDNHETDKVDVSCKGVTTSLDTALCHSIKVLAH